MWHVCEADGRQHSFLCPNGTIFNQHLLTCDWWFNVNCGSTHHRFSKTSEVLHKPLYNEIPKIAKKSTKGQFHTVKPKQIQYFNPTIRKYSSHPNPEQKRPTESKYKQTSPKFVEFQPYYRSSYPMFQLRKMQT